MEEKVLYEIKNNNCFFAKIEKWCKLIFISLLSIFLLLADLKIGIILILLCSPFVIFLFGFSITHIITLYNYSSIKFFNNRLELYDYKTYDNFYSFDTSLKQINYSNIKAIHKTKKYIYLLENDDEKKQVIEHRNMRARSRYIYAITHLYVFNDIIILPNDTELYLKIRELSNCYELKELNNHDPIPSDIIQEHISFQKINYFSIAFVSILIAICSILIIGAILQQAANSFLLNILEQNLLIFSIIGSILLFAILLSLSSKNIRYEFYNNYLNVFNFKTSSILKKIDYSYIINIEFETSKRLFYPNYIRIEYILPTSKQIETLRLRNTTEITMENIERIIRTSKGFLKLPFSIN